MASSSAATATATATPLAAKRRGVPGMSLLANGGRAADILTGKSLRVQQAAAAVPSHRPAAFPAGDGPGYSSGIGARGLAASASVDHGAGGAATATPQAASPSQLASPPQPPTPTMSGTPTSPDFPQPTTPGMPGASEYPVMASMTRDDLQARREVELFRQGRSLDLDRSMLAIDPSDSLAPPSVEPVQRSSFSIDLTRAFDDITAAGSVKQQVPTPITEDAKDASHDVPTLPVPLRGAAAKAADRDVPLISAKPTLLAPKAPSTTSQPSPAGKLMPDINVASLDDDTTVFFIDDDTPFPDGDRVIPIAVLDDDWASGLETTASGISPAANMAPAVPVQGRSAAARGMGHVRDASFSAVGHHGTSLSAIAADTPRDATPASQHGMTEPSGGSSLSSITNDPRTPSTPGGLFVAAADAPKFATSLAASADAPGGGPGGGDRADLPDAHRPNGHYDAGMAAAALGLGAAGATAIGASRSAGGGGGGGSGFARLVALSTAPDTKHSADKADWNSSVTAIHGGSEGKPTQRVHRASLVPMRDREEHEARGQEDGVLSPTLSAPATPATPHGMISPHDTARGMEPADDSASIRAIRSGTEGHQDVHTPMSVPLATGSARQSFVSSMSDTTGMPTPSSTRATFGSTPRGLAPMTPTYPLTTYKNTNGGCTIESPASAAVYSRAAAPANGEMDLETEAEEFARAARETIIEPGATIEDPATTTTKDPVMQQGDTVDPREEPPLETSLSIPPSAILIGNEPMTPEAESTAVHDETATHAAPAVVAATVASGAVVAAGATLAHAREPTASGEPRAAVAEPHAVDHGAVSEVQAPPAVERAVVGSDGDDGRPSSIPEPQLEGPSMAQDVETDVAREDTVGHQALAPEALDNGSLAVGTGAVAAISAQGAAGNTPTRGAPSSSARASAEHEHERFHDGLPASHTTAPTATTTETGPGTPASSPGGTPSTGSTAHMPVYALVAGGGGDKPKRRGRVPVPKLEPDEEPASKVSTSLAVPPTPAPAPGEPEEAAVPRGMAPSASIPGAYPEEDLAAFSEPMVEDGVKVAGSPGASPRTSNVDHDNDRGTSKGSLYDSPAAGISPAAVPAAAATEDAALAHAAPATEDAPPPTPAKDTDYHQRLTTFSLPSKDDAVPAVALEKREMDFMHASKLRKKSVDAQGHRRGPSANSPVGGILLRSSKDTADKEEGQESAAVAGAARDRPQTELLDEGDKPARRPEPGYQGVSGLGIENRPVRSRSRSGTMIGAARAVVTSAGSAISSGVRSVSNPISRPFSHHDTPAETEAAAGSKSAGALAAGPASPPVSPTAATAPEAGASMGTAASGRESYHGHQRTMSSNTTSTTRRRRLGLLNKLKDEVQTWSSKIRK